MKPGDIRALIEGLALLSREQHTLPTQLSALAEIPGYGTNGEILQPGVILLIVERTMDDHLSPRAWDTGASSYWYKVLIEGTVAVASHTLLERHTEPV